MQQVTMRADRRTERGTRPARRLRRSGKVPAVVYGRESEPIAVTVDAHDLLLAFHTEAGYNALINLEIDGEGHLTVAREIQRHPVRGEIAHLDFIKISLDVAIEADVTLEFTGTPEGVREGGIFEVIRTTAVVSALPTSVPNSIALDVSEMVIGDTVTVADLPAIEGVEYLDDAETAIASVLVPRLIEEEVVVEEELEGVELEEGEEGEEAEAADEDEG
jgi:large subunit ribosomal protein L25